MNNINKSLHNLAVDITLLKTLPGNPRRGDIEAVAKSYKTFGQRKPIIATKDGTVIAGNHQLAAAKKLGWTQIATIYVDDDLETGKAYALADNRTSELGTNDDTLLLAMAAEVTAKYPDLMQATGYTPDDLLALATPTLPEPTSETYATKWEIVIECNGEYEQEQIYNQLTAEGKTCRILTL